MTFSLLFQPGEKVHNVNFNYLTRDGSLQHVNARSGAGDTEHVVSHDSPRSPVPDSGGDWRPLRDRAAGYVSLPGSGGYTRGRAA